jgi:hypothetical protein
MYGMSFYLDPSIMRILESSLVGFGVLYDNTIKGITRVLSVEQVLSEKSKRFNT